MSTPTQYVTAEVYVIVNDAGDVVASDDQDHAAERFEEQIGELKDQLGIRRVKVSVRVPLPTVIELTATSVVDETETAAA